MELLGSERKQKAKFRLQMKLEIGIVNSYFYIVKIKMFLWRNYFKFIAHDLDAFNVNSQVDAV